MQMAERHHVLASSRVENRPSAECAAEAQVVRALIDVAVAVVEVRIAKERDALDIWIRPTLVHVACYVRALAVSGEKERRAFAADPVLFDELGCKPRLTGNDGVVISAGQTEEGTCERPRSLGRVRVGDGGDIVGPLDPLERL